MSNIEVPAANFDTVNADPLSVLRTQDIFLRNKIASFCIIQAFLLTEACYSLDIETTGDSWGDELLGLSLCVKSGSEYLFDWYPFYLFPELKTVVFDGLKGICADPSKTMIGHNMVFDLKYLKREGLEVKNQFFDTKVAQFMVDSVEANGLKDLAKKYLGKFGPTYKELMIEHFKAKANQHTLKDLSPQEVQTYAANDADITYKIKEILEEKLKEKDYLDYFKVVEMQVVTSLLEMEYTGSRLDLNLLEEAIVWFTQELLNVEALIYTLAGEIFNINSDQQTAYILFDKMGNTPTVFTAKTGKPSVAAGVLQTLPGELPQKLLYYNDLYKLLGTYLLPFKGKQVDGIIRYSFHSTGTRTGRLSSSHPNFQNIPTADETIPYKIRDLIIAPEGGKLLVLDYDQFEYRIMAHFSQDQGLLEILNSKEHFHTATAIKLFGSASQENLVRAKGINYGIPYGLGARGLSENLKCSIKEAKELLIMHQQKFPNLYKWIASVKRLVRTRGYAVTLFGRKLVVEKQRVYSGVDYTVQGTAAEIMKICQNHVYKKCQEGLSFTQRIQIHDELVGSAPEEKAEEVLAIIKDIMENTIKLDGLKLTVTTHICDRWSEAKI